MIAEKQGDVAQPVPLPFGEGRAMVGRVVWENAFAAVSVALGASEADVRASMSEEAAGRAELLTALGAPDKRARAKALATALTTLAMELQAAEASWDP